MGLPWWSVDKTLYSQCRGHRFDPWSGNYILLHASWHMYRLNIMVQHHLLESAVYKNLGKLESPSWSCSGDSAAATSSHFFFNEPISRKGSLRVSDLHLKCPEKANPQKQKVDWWLLEAGRGERLLMGGGFLLCWYKCFGIRYNFVNILKTTVLHTSKRELFMISTKLQLKTKQTHSKNHCESFQWICRTDLL